MFVVLQIERKRQNRLIGRLADILRPGRGLSYVPHQVMGGRYHIARWSGHSAPDWGALEELCSRSRDKVLVPHGVSFPESVRLFAPRLPRFERRVLLDTACEIARITKDAGVPLYRRILGIADPGGELAALLPALLAHYSCIKVYTENLEHYLAESERMMRELGAPVLPGCEPPSLGDCILILARDAQYLPKLPNVPVLCYTGFPGGSPCITSPQICPPDEIIAACPPRISLQDFAGALYEFCGVMDMNFAAVSMLCDYRGVTMREAASLILESINSSKM